MRITAPYRGARERASAKRSASTQWRWLLVPIILVVLIGMVFWWIGSRSTPVSTTTSTVSQGDLTLSVTGSGTIAAARTVELSFGQTGPITAVNVKVGDQVKTGQALATIDNSDLKLQVQQAEANLKAAEAKYGAAKNGSATPQDLETAKAQLESAKAQYTQTKNGTATKADIQSAQAGLAAAKAKLEALKNPSQADLSAAQSKVQQAEISLQSTHNSASQAKTNAQLSLDNATNSLTQAQSKYSIAQHNWQHVQDEGTDPAQPTVTGSDGKKKPNTLNDIQRQQYADAYIQAQASLENAQNAVTQAQVAYDAARQNEVSQVQQAEASLKDAQDTLTALQNPSASDVAQAQASVVQAQASLSKLTQPATAADMAQAQASVTQAQAGLDKLTAPASDPDIASAEATVLQAQASLASAQYSLDQATLTAPFDGVVSAVAAQLGAQASASTAAVTLVDRSKLHIDISLSESDAAKVQVGQPVTLTFDALPDVTLNGTVATVAPAATTSNNVVTFPVTIEFDPGTTAVKVGMSATADIEVQKVSNALTVPSRAVTTVGNTKSVTVLEGNQRTPVTVEVETGITSNGQTEVLSCVATGSQCLKAGDVLQISTTTTTTTANARSGFGGAPGGFGGFGGGLGGGGVRR